MKDQSEMSFLEHLEALRWHVIRAMIAVVAAAIIIFISGEWIFDTIIFGPKKYGFITYDILCNVSDVLCFRPDPFELITRDLGEQFIVHLKVSLWLGLIVAFPYVFYEFWSFIRPGLYTKEQKAVRGIVGICSLLFILGVLFGYFIMSPFAISFFSSYSVGAINAPTLNSYVGYLTMFTIPLGIVFELPVVIYFLAKMGLVEPSTLRSYRKHAFVVILLLAATITPPDLLTQLLISVPLYILYEISISIAVRVKRNQVAAESAST